MTAPRIGPRRVEYRNRYQRIDRVPVDFGGYTKEYFVNEYGSRAGLLVIDGDRILLVRQYRFLVDAVAWEIPGGSLNEAEPPIEGAARECREETGIRCRDLKPLLFFHPGLDTFHNPSHLFYSRDFEVDPAFTPDPREVGEWVWVPLSECVRMIFDGRIQDGFSITAILAYRELMGR